MIAFTRGRKKRLDFDPPEEYRSQQTQDEEEWDGNIGCSFGPHAKPSGAYSLEDELQYRLWDMGIRCEVRLVKKKDEAGSDHVSARLEGALAERLMARPVVQEWINNLWEKQNGGIADD